MRTDTLLVDMMTKGGLAFFLQLFDVADQPCVAVNQELLILLHLLILLLLFIYLLIDHLVYLRYLGGCLVAAFHALIQLVA